MIKNGVYAAGLSILKEDMSLDVQATITHAESAIKNGLHGAFFFGSTGQSQLISISEKKELISKTATSKYRDQFYIGTGVNSLNDNIDLIRYSMEYGFNTEIIKKLVANFPKQIIGCKDSSYNLFENLKIPNFKMFPGSEAKLLKGLELGCSGCISAVTNVTHSLARKVFDDFENKQQQSVNEKLINIRQTFDKHSLISALHSFLSVENKNYSYVLPPLTLLDLNTKKELLSKLSELDFIPSKNIAA